jgi:hypothetical protein
MAHGPLKLHTVVETPAYLSSAKRAGMTAAERLEAVRTLAEKPLSGEIVRETGGCRKLRVAMQGAGKSGGYRVMTFYVNESVPVFLLYAFAKGDRSNLDDEDKKALYTVAKAIKAAARAKSTPTGKEGE